MRVLGVDPGLTRCGLGVVDGSNGRKVRPPIAVDVVRTPAEMDLGSRLLRISDAAELWIDQYKPEVVAIERVFAQHNVSTAMGGRRKQAELSRSLPPDAAFRCVSTRPAR